MSLRLERQVWESIVWYDIQPFIIYSDDSGSTNVGLTLFFLPEYPDSPI